MKTELKALRFFQRAFTLIEALLVIVLIVVLLSLSFPSLRSFYQRSRLHSCVNQLVSLIQYARLQAMNSGQRVTLCGSRDGKACSANWGVEVLVKQGGALKRVWQNSAGVSIVYKGSFGEDSAVSFSAQGDATGQQGRWALCLPDHGACQAIVLSRSGRIRTEAVLASAA